MSNEGTSRRKPFVDPKTAGTKRGNALLRSAAPDYLPTGSVPPPSDPRSVPPPSDPRSVPPPSDPRSVLSPSDSRSVPPPSNMRSMPPPSDPRSVPPPSEPRQSPIVDNMGLGSTKVDRRRPSAISCSRGSSPLSFHSAGDEVQDVLDGRTPPSSAGSHDAGSTKLNEPLQF